MPVIPTQGRLKQEHGKLEARLPHILRLCVRKVRLTFLSSYFYPNEGKRKKECGFGLVGIWGECLRRWRRGNVKPQSEYILY